jgi:quinol monooxygenase YgiN
MVIVTGSILGTDESIDELIRLSLEHVRRSRTEPGCLSHAVHRDVENDNRLVFVERWVDRAALDVHFAVPESGAFVEAATALAAEPPTIDIDEVVERTS